MKKNTLNSALLIALVSFSISSCVSVKSTFEKDYSQKINVKPNRLVAIDRQGEKIIAVEQNQGAISISNTNEVALIQTDYGSVLWSERVNRLGDIGPDPETIEVIWEENILLMFSRSLTNFQVAAFDLNTQDQLWSRRESNPGRFSYSGFYHPQSNGYLIQTPEGLQSFSVRTGEILWARPDISININFGKMLLGIDHTEDVDLLYLENIDRFLISSGKKLILLNPENGKNDWQQTKDIGNVLQADIFEDEHVAVFYGPQSVKVSTLLSSLDGGRNMRAGVRAARALERGLRDNPLFFLDLNSGEILWENNFKTNGESKVLLSDDKLLISGLVTYAFDRETGNIQWQNVDQSRLDQEAMLSLLAEFTGFDFSASGKTTPEDLVLDNSIFVIYPEVFEDNGNRNEISVRRYDLETGDLIWKSEPRRIAVRDFFFAEGIIFVVSDGRFSRASNLHAFSPYDGRYLYSINTREPLWDLVITEERIYHIDIINRLNVYNIRNGEKMDVQTLGGRVVDIIDLNDKLWVAYSLGGRNSVIALHDRNSFRLINKVEVPFYSRDHIVIDDKFFLHYDSEQFKGVLKLDPGSLELQGYASATAKMNKTKDGRNIILDDYHLIIDDRGRYIYQIYKDELTRFRTE